eukprot:jgi/Mesvir1/14001/Mv02853-RA.1
MASCWTASCACALRRRFTYTVAALMLLTVMWLMGIAIAQIQPDFAPFCPCWNRASTTISFVMHLHSRRVSAGVLLRSGVHQAVRDRSLKLREYVPVQYFSVSEAVTFLDAEIQSGTSGIITTLYNDQMIPSLLAANAAGIPVYVIGGADPSLLATLRNNSARTSPSHSSLRYIGHQVRKVGQMLAHELIHAGITHVGCIITDVGALLWFRRCHALIEAMEATGRTGNWDIRSELSVDLAIYVTALENAYADVPGHQIAVVVMDSNVYATIKGRLRQGSKADATLVVYDTAVQVLQDIRDGYHAMALDPGYYTQGYLAVALAAAELQTGKMVTSDIEALAIFYGPRTGVYSLPVTDEVMQREVCRAAGNPVCGDPGVVPVTPSGCHCFNRSTVRYKVISGLPRSLPDTHKLWQGMKDAERDLPGSTFDWNVYEAASFFQVEDYQEAVSSSNHVGVICLDTVISDAIPELSAAIQSISQAGKPLYLAYGKSTPTDMQSFLDKYGARAYVGVSPYECGLHIGQLAVSAGARHLLANNIAPIIPWTWQQMRGLVAGVVGEEYQFPPRIWEWPITDHGNSTSRTGAWALFVDQDTNRTAQVMDGILPGMGDAFLLPIKQRLTTDVPAPDVLAIDASLDLTVTSTLALLSDLARNQPAREPVMLITQKCSSMEYLAMTRQGKVKGEELLLGCVDQQPYLSTYLSATLAALEQQTGEKLVGGVDTARLIMASQLPPDFTRRMNCELDGYLRGIITNNLGMFYPVCDARNGCVPEGLDAPMGATACSGYGSCQFPTFDADTSGSINTLQQGSCNCTAGWEGQYCQNVAPGTSNENHRYSKVLLAVLLSTGLALLLLGAAILLSVWRTRKGTDAKELHKFLRKRAPPRRGDGIAAVVTDIEGSTTLWERDPAVMNVALAIHHKVLRTLLPKYHGYESDTEGDSFTLVFHDAIDAMGWAMEVQRQLLFPAGVLGLPEITKAPLRTLRRSLDGAQGGDTCLTDWPPELLTMDAAKEVKDPMDGSVLYRGLRVRMGIHIGVPDACSMHPNGRQRYQGDAVELAKAIQGAAASGGQVLMSTVAWNSLGVHMQSVICHHMGMHEVDEKLPPMHVMQVLPQELKKRAPYLPLKSKQLWPSFFDAPCARECYLQTEPPKQPVVICFIYVGSASTLRRTPGYQQAVNLLVSFVQSRLSQYEAYECEEKDGNFLLAFRSPIQAAHFAEAVQREAMDLDWPEHLLEQEAAAEVVKLAGDKAGTPSRKERIVFRGLRLQIGLCMGVPKDCQPHMATGRAAYFGPVVNRAARIAATAAPGQTLANQDVFEGAKGQTQGIIFQELGEYGLKGIMELLCLYQISSEGLSLRLFPRTLKLAKYPAPQGVGLLDESMSDGGKKHSPRQVS